MRALRTFFRPGWIALIVVVVAFAALCFSLLAPWQLGKSSSTEHRNDLIRAAVDTPVTPVGEVVPAGAAFDPDTEWRQVSVVGTYLADQQVLVRFRYADQQPAFEILTPFALSGSDRIILVNRGHIPRPEGAQALDIPQPPAGEVTINARIRKGESTSPGREAHADHGMAAVYSIDPAQAGPAVGLDVDPFYLQLSSDQPGSLGEIGLPQLNTGPYLSYGLQWLAFGIMAPLGAGYFIYSEIKHRRRDRNASSTAVDDIATAEHTDSGEPSADSEQLVPSAPTSRRAQIKADLQAAGTDADTRYRDGIGHGPDTSTSTADVRDKLSRRYGG